MLGENDVLYIEARRMLLDTLEALYPHHNALILVGAQAVYLHIPESGLAVSPFTMDADIAFDPAILAAQPHLDDVLRDAGFTVVAGAVGVWTNGHPTATVDLLVPAAVSVEGKRKARLPDHGNDIARKSPGLEGALLDKSLMRIQSLDQRDPRSCSVHVAGPTALLVAKLHKIHDRKESASRREDKDALDILRLLQAFDTSVFVQMLKRFLSDPRSESVCHDAIGFLDRLFAEESAPGSCMAARATQGLMDSDEVTQSCAFLAQDILIAFKDRQ